jgi:hypothetical protein
MNYHLLMGYNFTTTQLLAASVVLVVVVLVALGAFIQRRRERNPALRDRFVSDFDRVFLGFGSEHLLGGRLADRVSPDQAAKIRELNVSEREWVVSEWQAIQSNFADHPRTALIEADDLINALLDIRGYHEASFEQREVGVSVDDQCVMKNFRLPHSVAAQFGPVEPTPEELGKAMNQYRDIFDYLQQAPKRPETEPLHKSGLEAKRGLTGARAM